MTRPQRFWDTLVLVVIVAVLAYGAYAVTAGVAWPAATHCESTSCLKKALRWHKKNEARLRVELVRRHRLELRESIHMASILFGVSERAMTCVAWHESGFGAQTTPEPSSGALGPFQWLSGSWASTPLGRAGYSRLDPLASSLSTAQRVVIDGGTFREWVTARGCGVR